MGIVKSKLLKQLSKNYPNFFKKDLEKFTNIILKEIKETLKRGERVELRGFGVFYTKLQKARISRNPKTGEKVNTPEKKTINFKMAKDLFKKLNNEKNKIFVACDSSNISKIREIIKKTKNSKLIVGYKFGLEFLNSKNGRLFVSKLKNTIIFADLKIHDIPNTCVSTIKAIKDLKLDYLTIHISAGLNALKACKKISHRIKMVGVTTLTSLDNKALKEIGYNRKIKNLVQHQASLAQKANLDAIVCSAQEVKIVKKVFKKEIITPGIRFGTKNNDQKRTLTPKKAFLNGSDWLVIGRPITKGNIKKNLKRLIDHLNQ